MNAQYKHPLEDLSEQQLEEVSVYDIPMTEVNMHNIYNRFLQERKPHKSGNRRRLLTAILVAVIAVALVGFTNADRIQMLYYKLFGGTVQLEQNDYSKIGESATEQGFRMEVLSAVRDGENLYLLIDITDIEQNRLSDDLNTYVGIEGISKNAGELSVTGAKTELLEYNGSRKTATLGVHAIGSFNEDEAVLTIPNFSCGEVNVDHDVPEIDLYSLVKDTPQAFQRFDAFSLGGWSLSARDSAFADPTKIEDILVLDVIELHIPGYSKDYISNIAYRDGMLHVQYNCGDNRGSGDYGLATIRHRETGEDLAPLYTLIYGINYLDSPEFRDTYPNVHIERVYELESLEALNDYILHVAGRYYEKVYHGPWRVRFSAPMEITSVDLPVSGQLSVSGQSIEIKRVTVTPLSVTIVLGVTVFDDLEVAVIYANGDRKILALNGMFGYGNGEQEWYFTSAFLFREISSVEINGTIIEFPRAHPSSPIISFYESTNEAASENESFSSGNQIFCDTDGLIHLPDIVIIEVVLPEKAVSLQTYLIDKNNEANRLCIFDIDTKIAGEAANNGGVMRTTVSLKTYFPSGFSGYVLTDVFNINGELILQERILGVGYDAS